jgi:hypothetical protein
MIRVVGVIRAERVIAKLLAALRVDHPVPDANIWTFSISRREVIGCVVVNSAVVNSAVINSATIHRRC